MFFKYVSGMKAEEKKWFALYLEKINFTYIIILLFSIENS